MYGLIFWPPGDDTHRLFGPGREQRVVLGGGREFGPVSIARFLASEMGTAGTFTLATWHYAIGGAPARGTFEAADGEGYSVQAARVPGGGLHFRVSGTQRTLPMRPLANAILTADDLLLFETTIHGRMAIVAMRGRSGANLDDAGVTLDAFLRGVTSADRGARLAMQWRPLEGAQGSD